MAWPLSKLPVDPILRDAHTNALDAITTRVKSLYAAKTPFRIYHGSTNSTRQSTHTRDNIVDTSSLDKVLLVDEDEGTSLVEPNVSMEKLVGETLRRGLVPPVVMEFPGITAGVFAFFGLFIFVSILFLLLGGCSGAAVEKGWVAGVVSPSLA